MFKKLSEEIIIQYLKNNKAGEIKHIKSGTLLDHLRRVKELLESWEVSQDVCIAGLCHSILSTEFFTTQVVTPENEDDFELLVGKRVMELIRHFSVMERSTLRYQEDVHTGSYRKRLTGETVTITKQDVADLLTILIANEIDHINGINFHDIEASLRKYRTLFPLLPEKVYAVADKLVKTIKNQNNKEFVSYISHATIWYKNLETSLIVDPWFFSSTIQSPLIQGLRPNQKTIDYLIPKPVNSIEEIRPDIILISHFHTHHSPLREITYFAKNRTVKIICPPLQKEELDQVASTLGEAIFANITFIFVEKDTEIKEANISIKVFTHTRKNHLGFHVSSTSLSFVHLSDSVAGTDDTRLTLDPIWNKLSTYPSPHHLFISASNHSQLSVNGHERRVIEHTSLSPVQASSIAKILNPKKVSLIGMSNFSIWDSGIEYTESPESVFNYFSWVMRFLLPSTEVTPLNPGDTFVHENY